MFFLQKVVKIKIILASLFTKINALLKDLIFGPPNLGRLSPYPACLVTSLISTGTLAEK